MGVGVGGGGGEESRAGMSQCIKRESRVHVRFFYYVGVDTFTVVVLVIFVSFNASSTPMYS